MLELTGLFIAPALLLWNAAEIFLPAFAGILLALFLNTPAHYLARRTRIPHGWALALVVILLLALAAGGARPMGPSLVDQATGLAEGVPTSMEQVRERPLAFTEGADQVLYVMILHLAVQQLEGNVIRPLVRRRAVDLPPALATSAVFVGGAAFGPVGLLVATPLVAVVVVPVKMLYPHQVLHEHVELPGGKGEG